MKNLSGFALLMAAVIASPVGAALAVEASTAAQSPVLISRGGGGGGGGRMGGGGGGARLGGGGGVRAGGGRAGSGSLGRSGFQGSGGAGGLNRGANRPAGGWSSGAAGGLGRPSLNRPVARPGGTPGLNRPVGAGAINRNVNANLNRNLNVNRNINRSVNRNWNRSVNVNAFAVRPGWARPGWGVARPWNHGWYGGWATPSWGWWGARAAAWSVGTLATAAIINNAVDAAVASNQTVIVVPNTQYQLLFGTVQPTGTSTVSFDVSSDGGVYGLSADCQSGLLNGQVPTNAQEAELLNAACQVAFGTAS